MTHIPRPLKSSKHMNEPILFTHYWVTGFGWENTIYNSNDFVDVDFFGETEKEGKVYVCTNDRGGRQILKVNAK